ncbi:signal peptidase I [Haloparvum sp. AD34]
MALKPWHAVALVAVALLAIAAAPATSPVTVSYVSSDSMEPTIAQGDGYILVPAGEIETGDVITFYSEDRNVYVTHRVVRETSDGFVTQGDNNPTPDQATGLSPVQRHQIVGEVLTVGGEPVTIPSLGPGAEFVRSHPLGVLLGGLLAWTVSVAFAEGRRRRPDRTVLRVRDVALPVFGVALPIAVGFVLLTATHSTFTYTAVEGGGTSAATLPVSEAATRSNTVRLVRSVLTTVVISADGADVAALTVTERSSVGLVAERTTVNATMSVTADAVGPHRTTLHVYVYPATLPESVLLWLHHHHPFWAASASVSALFAPVCIGYALFVDGETPLRTPRIRTLRRLFGDGNP